MLSIWFLWYRVYAAPPYFDNKYSAFDIVGVSLWHSQTDISKTKKKEKRK
jgi:hypothetical protein